MSTPLDYAPRCSSDSSADPNFRSDWTPLSAAAVGCCVLFVVGVAGAAAIHPSIPPAMIITIILAAPAAAGIHGAAPVRRRAGPRRQGGDDLRVGRDCDHSGDHLAAPDALPLE